MKQTHRKILALCVCCAVSLFKCASIQSAGDTSQTGNTYVLGRAFDGNSQPAANTEITAIPADYNPVVDHSQSGIFKDTTGADGSYAVRASKGIEYNIQAISIVNRTRFLISSIKTSAETTFVSDDTLKKTGTVVVTSLSGVDSAKGYLYIPGTFAYTPLAGANGSIVLDSVPAGVDLSVFYTSTGSSALPQQIRDSVTVAPGGTATVTYIAWKYSKKLVLNTTASGAGISGTVTNFPVLVRLVQADFDFSRSNATGSDLRFTKPDGTPLSYQIDTWDSANGTGRGMGEGRHDLRQQRDAINNNVLRKSVGGKPIQRRGRVRHREWLRRRMASGRIVRQRT